MRRGDSGGTGRIPAWRGKTATHGPWSNPAYPGFTIVLVVQDGESRYAVYRDMTYLGLCDGFGAAAVLVQDAASHPDDETGGY